MDFEVESKAYSKVQNDDNKNMIHFSSPRHEGGEFWSDGDFPAPPTLRGGGAGGAWRPGLLRACRRQAGVRRPAAHVPTPIFKGKRNSYFATSVCCGPKDVRLLFSEHKFCLS